MREDGKERMGDLNYFFSLRFFLRFMEIRSLIFVRAEGKVGLHDEGYAWAPKS